MILPPTPGSDRECEETRRVPLTRIRNLKWDRKDRTSPAYKAHFDRLVADIARVGVRTPLKVVAEGDGFRLIAGQTRKRAAEAAGLTEAPVQVLPAGMSDTELLVVELTDNNMQLGFDWLAQAAIYQELMEANHWTQAELTANVPAATESSVSKSLSMLDRLIDALKDRLIDGTLGPRLAYKLSRLPADLQAGVWPRIDGLKVAAAEAVIDGLTATKAKKPKAVKVKGKNISGSLSGTLEAVAEEAARLMKACQKAISLGLGLSAVPDLLAKP